MVVFSYSTYGRIIVTFFALATILSLLLSSTSSWSTSSIFVEACNTTYCNNRGNGSSRIGGTDNCSCDCSWPYFGLKCLYEYTSGGAAVVINCSATFGSSAELCNASSQCYWNSGASLCASKLYPSSVNDTPINLVAAVPWCYRLLPLPLEIAVYLFATAAFGVGGVGFFYMMRYRNTYSVLEANGERMFNQFVDNSVVHVLTTIYCLLLFVTAGVLAISAYINFRDPSVCVYVYFFIAYLAVQAMCVIWPIGWTFQFLAARCASPAKKRVDLDFQVKPSKPDREYNRRSCQLKCF